MIRLAPFLLLSACVSAPIAPNLKLPEPAKECPKLALPSVPNEVHLTIKGDQIEADAGGALLLRGYVRARSLLK
jgi:hypothetical protein